MRNSHDIQRRGPPPTRPSVEVSELDESLNFTGNRVWIAIDGSEEDVALRLEELGGPYAVVDTNLQGVDAFELDRVASPAILAALGAVSLIRAGERDVR